MSSPDPDERINVDAMAHAIVDEAALAGDLVPPRCIVQALVLAAAMVAEDSDMPPSEFGKLLMETIMRRVEGSRR